MYCMLCAYVYCEHVSHAERSCKQEANGQKAIRNDELAYEATYNIIMMRGIYNVTNNPIRV